MDNFVIENYGTKPPFSSFLPGISGLHGVPVWCFYVSRGQGVASFGLNTKQNAIMEFYPAHQAYQNAKTTGFRTFLRSRGKVWEPFSDETVPARMEIGMNTLDLTEEDAEHGIRTHVSYFTLPNEPIGALIRTLSVTNTASDAIELEIADGMPALIPCGVDLDRMKAIGQTVKAWMQVEDAKERTPYYRTRASLADTAEVASVEAGNYAVGFSEDGALLPVIANPALIFSYDTALRRPAGLEQHALEDLLSREQTAVNVIPCAFFGRICTLKPGESVSIHEIYGQVPEKKVLRDFLTEKHDAAWFRSKQEEAISLTDALTERVQTHTASPAFDAACRYNYMDNVLRGGYPIRMGTDRVFYAYARKHGDLERDYNDFSMLPEYFSQGNGNFRDVAQNRRCDTFLAPFVGAENIRKFFSLIQLDGYNPLSIEKRTYRLTAEDAERFTVPEDPELSVWLTEAHTPGQILTRLEQTCFAGYAQKQFQEIMDAAEEVAGDTFGEGYWTDHWTYLLDLVEDYLEVYPDREQDLLFRQNLTCFLSQANINRRERRYAETARGLRQYRALNEETRRNTLDKWVRGEKQTGDILYFSLLEKLVLLCTLKFAALDAWGMGLEMEGGKPGWYDALNGLPGRFGSSMNETYELQRTLRFTAEKVRKYGKPVPVLEELAALLTALDRINREEQTAVHSCDAVDDPEQVRAQGEVLRFWNQINDVKEIYRDKTYEGVCGAKTEIAADSLAGILEAFADTLQSGIHKAVVLAEGVIPAYFAYEVPNYTRTEQGIHPLRFVPVSLPPFLEGSVRYLKLPAQLEEKRKVWETVRASDLYDSKLQMYKVNASLSSASLEFGRAIAFPAGWLENESIWLHMEYKYLLELLRSGLYQEFFQDFHAAAIPFLDPDVYGRSIYEASSFLVSSACPDRSLHGRGFVARLSGSTAELLSMWKLIFFGRHVLSLENGALVFTPQPAIPAWLIPADRVIETTLFGETKLQYRFRELQDYFPGSYTISGMTFTYKTGETVQVRGDRAAGSIPEDLRDGRIASVSAAIS